ncbi:MAG: anthranilate synthase component I [Dissulfurispiraceae bacterium]|jgi:anthranilate synthase component 1|nr:anthranilate synthase component I [Dissulfurispiraceae bacterium]
MLYPSLNEFRSLSKKGNLIPVYREILGDLETPVTAFLKLKRKPAFLLESVVGGEKWARYSFLGIDPALTVVSKKSSIQVNSYSDMYRAIAEKSPKNGNPLLAVKNILSSFNPVDVKGLPRFSGGFVGYCGYDIVKFFERVPDNEKPGLDMPDTFLMLTDTLLIFDNLKQTIKIVHNAHINGRSIEDSYRHAESVINGIIDELRSSRLSQDNMPMPYVALSSEGVDVDHSDFRSNFTKQDFMDAVAAAKEYVLSGDVVQVVLSQRFEADTSAAPFDIYRALRVINPSPYMYFLDTGCEQLVGSSPEILVRVEGSDITVRPIAGTRKRGTTESEDKALERELKNDPKEVAEHIMLVDLGRNDVGRVAETGSVKVTDLMYIERYSHVMHLVSNVYAKLKKGLDAFDVFMSCFPAGTVSGAPKVRAMEIIEELEPTCRGSYAGSVGYFGYSGNMDTCITIRTLIIKDKKVYVQAGAGIVADSVPESEYLETVNKAMGMMKALKSSEETFS